MSTSAVPGSTAAAGPAALAFPNGVSPAPTSPLAQQLSFFKQTQGINSKGRLSQMVYLSRVARQNGLPLAIGEWLTEGGGQIKGAGGDVSQRILQEYNVTRRLSAEGGRTSRGSLGYVETYIRVLNELHEKGTADTAAIEKWWIDRVVEFFNASPFQARFDPGKNLRAVISDLMEQANKRQREMPGAKVVGTMLQHLVGAKLELCLPAGAVTHHNSSTADAPGGRAGDFLVANSAIHVTTAPGDALMNKCKENLRMGNLHPIVVTTYERTEAARQSADIAGIQDKVEILDVEQFVATNLLELGRFATDQRRVKLGELIANYNAIIDQTGEDPSLKIDM